VHLLLLRKILHYSTLNKTLGIQVTGHSPDPEVEHESRRSGGQQRFDEGLQRRHVLPRLRQLRPDQQRSTEDN
jgi:hypothetical protein